MIRRVLVVAYLVLSVTVAGATDHGQSNETTARKAADIAQQIVNDPDRYRTDVRQLRPLVGNERVVDAVIAAAKETPVDTQRRLLDVITMLGSELRAPDATVMPRYHFISSEHVIGFCVNLLRSPHPQLRSKAAEILITKVRPKDVRSRAPGILDALGRPTSRAEYVIMGMIGTGEAMERLPDIADVEEVLLPARKLASAMLGDSRAEEEIIECFGKTRLPEQQTELAMALAYIGSRKSLTALASALRSPDVVRWGGGGRQSFRLVVIASLSWVYPDEKVLWVPRTPPTSDEYYEAIEQWAERQLSVHWRHPRPPFLYQEYAPMFPHVQQ